MDPTSPTDVVLELLGRVQVAVEAVGGDPLSTVTLNVGGAVWDDCCGQLTGYPLRVFRSTSFPAENVAGDNCFGGFLVVTMGILLLRCMPVGDVDREGNLVPPPAGTQTDAARTLLDEAAAVWNAIAAPLPEGWQRANLSQQFPAAEGGCAAVETLVTIGVDLDTWP